MTIKTKQNLPLMILFNARAVEKKRCKGYALPLPRAAGGLERKGYSIAGHDKDESLKHRLYDAARDVYARMERK